MRQGKSIPPGGPTRSVGWVGSTAWPPPRRSSGCWVAKTSMRQGKSIPPWRSEPCVTPTGGKARRASSPPRRVPGTNPASARSWISAAEAVDTAAERLTAASAIAAMASATSTSISVNPREADPPNDVSVNDELLARARHGRGELAAQAVRREHHALAGRQVATVDAHARELGAPGERAAAVEAGPRIQDPVAVLAALPEGVALRHGGPGDAAAARARLAWSPVPQ